MFKRLKRLWALSKLRDDVVKWLLNRPCTSVTTGEKSRPCQECGRPCFWHLEDADMEPCLCLRCIKRVFDSELGKK